MYYCCRCVRSVATTLFVHVFVKYFFWCASNFLFILLKKKMLIVSVVLYIIAKRERREIKTTYHMCARICAFVLFPDEWPSVTIQLSAFLLFLFFSLCLVSQLCYFQDNAVARLVHHTCNIYICLLFFCSSILDID